MRGTARRPYPGPARSPAPHDVNVGCGARPLSSTLEDMFTSVPDLAAAAAERQRALLDDAATFRLARQARKARRRWRVRPAAPGQGGEQRFPRSA